jgi:hypothetical protein
MKEDLFGSKLDKCVTNLIVNTGTGLAIGIGLSFLFFRRSYVPIAATTSFGAGMAYMEYIYL